MEVVFKNANGKIIHGDNIDMLDELSESSVDSCISDFPYAIEFMGKNWDSVKCWNQGKGIVLQYLVEYNVPYASVYGEIYQEQDGTYKTTGCNRTGCVFCMFGCHLEKPENRFQKLAKTHPKLYDYCINGGEEVDGVWQPSKEGLGLGRVLDYINVDYIPIKQLKSKRLFELN